jgi:protein-L-isoaspartate(D-aspartate) O-methyltransferase
MTYTGMAGESTFDEAKLDAQSADNQRLDERRRMVDEQIRARNINDPRVLQAMFDVPRHQFIPADEQALAYADQAVPIGEGQTISQPYIVALMTEALMASPEARVLEIGTGSGYQAAVLSRLVAHVFSVERHVTLAFRAMALFQELGYENISVRIGDGTLGWPQHAPFDNAIVTAAGPRISPAIVAQVRPGGTILLPVGRKKAQRLQRLWVRETGFITEDLGRVAFVPLVGRYGWRGNPPKK